MSKTKSQKGPRDRYFLVSNDERKAQKILTTEEVGKEYPLIVEEILENRLDHDRRGL